jgi:hypothetical protein
MVATGASPHAPFLDAATLSDWAAFNGQDARIPLATSGPVPHTIMYGRDVPRGIEVDSVSNSSTGSVSTTGSLDTTQIPIGPGKIRIQIPQNRTVIGKLQGGIDLRKYSTTYSAVTGGQGAHVGQTTFNGRDNKTFSALCVLVRTPFGAIITDALSDLVDLVGKGLTIGGPARNWLVGAYLRSPEKPAWFSLDFCRGASIEVGEPESGGWTATMANAPDGTARCEIPPSESQGRIVLGDSTSLFYRAQINVTPAASIGECAEIALKAAVTYGFGPVAPLGDRTILARIAELVLTQFGSIDPVDRMAYEWAVTAAIGHPLTTYMLAQRQKWSYSLSEMQTYARANSDRFDEFADNLKGLFVFLKLPDTQGVRGLGGLYMTSDPRPFVHADHVSLDEIPTPPDILNRVERPRTRLLVEAPLRGEGVAPSVSFYRGYGTVTELGCSHGAVDMITGILDAALFDLTRRGPVSITRTVGSLRGAAQFPVGFLGSRRTTMVRTPFRPHTVWLNISMQSASRDDRRVVKMMNSLLRHCALLGHPIGVAARSCHNMPRMSRCYVNGIEHKTYWSGVDGKVVGPFQTGLQQRIPSTQERHWVRTGLFPPLDSSPLTLQAVHMLGVSLDPDGEAGLWERRWQTDLPFFSRTRVPLGARDGSLCCGSVADNTLWHV